MIELLTVIAVVAILSVMVFGVTNNLQRRADRARCVSNLKNLYAATNVYIQRNESWPQIDYRMLQGAEHDYAQAWISALQPCGLGHQNWLCPTVQRELGNPDVKDEKHKRIDYMASPFDSRPIAPFEFPTQPWFAERGDPHGDGNLIILTNGQIVSLRELVGVK